MHCVTSNSTARIKYTTKRIGIGIGYRYRTIDIIVLKENYIEMEIGNKNHSIIMI